VTPCWVQVEDENLFSTDGLKPSIHDLDNIFEDSDTELNLDGTLAVPTPPSSVKVQCTFFYTLSQRKSV
jgi:hypothetical protein